MKKLIPVMLSLLFLQSCTGSLYEGRPVNMRHPAVCSCVKLPKTCHLSNDSLKMEYEVRKIGPNKYIVEGSLIYLKSTWQSFSNARFALLLINDGKVVESISFQGGRGSLAKGVKFKKEFTPKQKFIATMMDFNMNVRG